MTKFVFEVKRKESEADLELLRKYFFDIEVNINDVLTGIRVHLNEE